MDTTLAGSYWSYASNPPMGALVAGRACVQVLPRCLANRSHVSLKIGPSPSNQLACDLCSAVLSVGPSYFEMMRTYGTVYCSTCFKKVTASESVTDCLSCNGPIKYSMHVIQTKGCAPPATCQICQMAEEHEWFLVQ
ncbi:Alpha-protein kinase vwkA [Durusdinium trenchii]|uniref:Alpha-protein kinase vwkA n=1 Tax=Durusdinium trenchii TaxID=1381693 RepID=A0ABP0KHP1_9DINO